MYKNGKSYQTFDVEYIENPQPGFIQIKDGLRPLHSAIYVPSTMHAYSLGIQYIRDWFLSKFDKNYFKTVYVNGSHILADYKRYSIIQSTFREKPAVAITPNIDFDFDREMLDRYMGGKDFLMAKYNHRQGFFKDFDNNIFLGLTTRDQRITFNIKCRVESRAQQLDLYRNIQLACRVGFTQYEYISCDYHIPMEIILNIAHAAGFKIIEKKKGVEMIEDIIGFTSYLNQHSEFPIIYKLRQVSGRNEFFMRVNNVWAHIDTREDLNYDDGEREGHLDNNFHVELNCALRMFVPAFYVYKACETVYKYIPTADSSSIGLWTCEVLDIPEQNKQGWQKLIYTDYDLDDNEIAAEEFDIDISPLFMNKDICTIINLNLKMNISPSKFIELRFLKSDPYTEFSINWQEMKVHVKNCNNAKLYMVFFLDKEYYNGQLATLKDMNTTRIN